MDILTVEASRRSRDEAENITKWAKIQEEQGVDEVSIVFQKVTKVNIWDLHEAYE